MASKVAEPLIAAEPAARAPTEFVGSLEAFFVKFASPATLRAPVTATAPTPRLATFSEAVRAPLTVRLAAEIAPTEPFAVFATAFRSPPTTASPTIWAAPFVAAS